MKERFESSVPSLEVLQDFVRVARQIYTQINDADLIFAHKAAHTPSRKNLREKIFHRLLVDVIDGEMQARGLVVKNKK